MAGRDDSLLAEAYAALDCGRADVALERFEAACSEERSGAALEGLARADYLRTEAARHAARASSEFGRT